MMRCVLNMLIVTLIIYRPVSGAIILADFQQQALIQHNYQRQLHCTNTMTLNSTLNSIAQNYSNYLAANNLFIHSGASGLGENLYSMWSSASISFVNGSTPTISWYNEISSYNYSSPGFSSATGHFTQVIWSGSTQLGIGIALTSNNQTAYAVANYYPAGNLFGSFPANVLPLCSTTTTTTTTVAGTITTTVGTVSTTAGSVTTSGTTIASSSTTTTRATNNSAILDKQINIRLTTMIVLAGSLFNLASQN